MTGMIPVAVVLIVLVIVFTIAIIIGNPQSFDLLVFVARIPANITGVYVTGAVTMLVLAVAGWLLWTGLIRMRAQHKEIRDLKVAAGARTKSIPAGGTKAAKTDPATAKKDADAKGVAAKAERETGKGTSAREEAHSPKEATAGRPRRPATRDDAEGDLTASKSHGSDPSTDPDHGDRGKSSRDPGDDQSSTTAEERRTNARRGRRTDPGPQGQVINQPGCRAAPSGRRGSRSPAEVEPCLRSDHDRLLPPTVFVGPPRS